MLGKKDILVIHGEDIMAMTEKILRAADLKELVGDRERHIVLKPNLVVARPANEGATTHPEFIVATIEYLQKYGFKNISIVEGSWIGDSTKRAFRACGYEKIAKELGVKLVDTKTSGYHERKIQDQSFKISEPLRETDFLINFPVLKGHCQTTITCALKNLKGLIPDSEKRRFHGMGLMKPIAYLNAVIRQDFIIVDGICGDPDFEEGGNPLVRGQSFATRDPVLCDAYASTVLGYKVEDVPYIDLAQQLGVGISDLNQAEIRFLNKPQEAPNIVRPTGIAKLLGKYVDQKEACSACYANLICAIYLLEKQNPGSSLFKAKGKVAVGQGFKDEKGDRGVGICTKGFEKSLTGCPPSTESILKWLKEIY